MKHSPLSETQRQALKLLDRGGFVRTRAGWVALTPLGSLPHPPETGGVNAFSGATVISLERRGLVRFKMRGKRPATAYITPKGRSALVRVRTPEQLEMPLPGAPA